MSARLAKALAALHAAEAEYAEALREEYAAVCGVGTSGASLGSPVHGERSGLGRRVAIGHIDGTTKERIAKCLAEFGPMTAHQMSEKLGIGRQSIHAEISLMRRAGAIANIGREVTTGRVVFAITSAASHGEAAQ